MKFETLEILKFLGDNMETEIDRILIEKGNIVG